MSLLTAKLEIFISDCENGKCLTICCFEFDFSWSIEIDPNLTANFIENVQHRLIQCGKRLAVSCCQNVQEPILSAWKIADDLTFFCKYNFLCGHKANLKNTFLYDWYVVGLDEIPLPTNSIYDSFFQLSNHLLLFYFEKKDSTNCINLKIRNFFLPQINAAWLMLSIAKMFQNPSNVYVATDGLSRRILETRPLTKAIAFTENHETSLLLPDELNL